MIDHVYKPDGHCERCGQTPWDDSLGIDNMLYGRSKRCLTDEQLKELALYYANIRTKAES